MKKQIHSFDIFDTLLARTVKNPIDIFYIIEKKYPYNNFLKIRIESQKKSNGTMDDIYVQFKKITNESDDNIKKIREFELTTEMTNTIPILCNILKINDGDILVSDMYLSHDEIMKLLHFHNIKKNIELYVTPFGKLNGEIWNKLIQKYEFIDHIGDNIHSDINMAKKYKIKGILTNSHKFTQIESNLISINYDICCIFRKFRLMNPYYENTIENKLYNQQIEFNIPLLLFMCKKISDILINENRNTVLFLSRDGCLIIKLFEFLYPQFTSIYCHSSRHMNVNYNDDYISYLKNIYTKDSCLIFDLHGSFNSGRKLFMNYFGHLPRIFLFSLTHTSYYENNMTYITNDNNDTKGYIEYFNVDFKGSLINFIQNKDIRLPCENNKIYVKIIHDTIDKFMKFIEDNKFVNVILDNQIFNNDKFWNEYYISHVKKCDKILNFFPQHTTMTLTEIANNLKIDKGNKYGDCHHYTVIYEEIINDILNIADYDIDLLEIGLNINEKSNEIPSLIMWKTYFYDKINIVGFDIRTDFLKHNNLYKNLIIMCGDQSNIADLQQLKFKKYDIIIDDGYHASKHQQISFKTLWSNVKSNGYYIIEDLHYHPKPEKCITTKMLFENWKNNNWIETEFINLSEIQTIKDEIQFIEFRDSKFSKQKYKISPKNAFVFIKKK
jgi:hypothetical protein